MPSTLNREAVWVATISERYVLPAIYIGFAYIQWAWVRIEWPGLVHVGDPASVGNFSNDATVLALDLLMAIVLLIGRRPVVAPRVLKDIAVPLAASYYFLLFTCVSLLPRSLDWLQRNRAPTAWQGPLSYTSLALGAGGTLVAIWGLVALGRSFGIFVAVRTVVLRGPYRLVRHPMYSGYIVASAGLLLADANIALAILVPVQIALFIWRAKLEEERLSEFSPDYRAYQERTGFLFPRLVRP